MGLSCIMKFHTRLPYLLTPLAQTCPCMNPEDSIILGFFAANSENPSYRTRAGRNLTPETINRNVMHRCLSREILKIKGVGDAEVKANLGLRVVRGIIAIITLEIIAIAIGTHGIGQTLHRRKAGP